MSLDVYLEEVRPSVVFEANATHNLNKMASEAGLYKALWRPEEIGISHARQLIAPLEEGLVRLEAAPDHFKTFNPPNKWGNYDGFVEFVRDYLGACREFPDATVRVSR